MITLALLSLGFLAVLSTLGIFSEDHKEKKDTAEIDVTLEDQNGYRHFLVFSKIKTPDHFFVDDSVQFWVDDYVLIDPSKVSRLVFMAEGKSWSCVFESVEEVKGRNPQPTKVFHFALEESAIQSLADFKVGKVRMVMRDGDFMDFSLLDERKFEQAAKMISVY